MRRREEARCIASGSGKWRSYGVEHGIVLVPLRAWPYRVSSPVRSREQGVSSILLGASSSKLFGIPYRFKPRQWLESALMTRTELDAPGGWHLERGNNCTPKPIDCVATGSIGPSFLIV